MTSRQTLWLLLPAILLLASCSASTPPGVKLPDAPGWKLVFSDEFSGTELDPTQWNTCYPWTEADGGCTNAGNNELEWYQPEAVSVSGGSLHLKAEKRSVRDGFPYTSGMVTSHEKFAFQYGYVETRLKVPAGQGIWPAVWLLPEAVKWPPEIDILEVLGHKPHEVHTTIHYTTDGKDHLSQGSSYSGPDFSADFHTFGLLWEPDIVIWYVDGVERFAVEREGPNIPQEPFYLLANLAVGGNWPGAPDETTVFPSEMLIDYIRVYRNESYLSTAGGPTPTPSGGKNILHAASVTPVDKDGQALADFPPGIVRWNVEVVNQDGRPVRDALVVMAVLDQAGNETQRLSAWEKTDRRGAANFSALIKAPGEYRLQVVEITLFRGEASYDAQADTKPVKITVK